MTSTLESTILPGRETCVQLIAPRLGDDLSPTSGIIEYYRTQADVVEIFRDPNPGGAAQRWLNATFYSHPRIDGMFVVAPDGKLIASVPSVSGEIAQNFSAASWREGAMAAPATFVSPVHPRLSDKRMAVDIVGA